MTIERIPAEAPIDGPLWTYVVPVLLFLVAFSATFALYRHFARTDSDGT